MNYACEDLEVIRKRMEELEKETLERIRMTPIEETTEEAKGPVPIVWPYGYYAGYP